MTLEPAKTTAELLADWSQGVTAWNMPKDIQSELVNIRVTAKGSRYTFIDGSVAFVPHGESRVEVKAARWRDIA